MRRVIPSSRIAVVSFISFFVFYSFFVSPGLLPADSGEFQVVATLLGVAHPPGFPFYTLLGKLFITLAPLGSPAYRLNLLSALLAAAALVFVAEAVRALTRSRFAGLVAACALGVSTTFWSQATTANVRMLTALCAAAALYFLARLHAEAESPISNLQFLTSRPAFLYLLAFSLGLGISHHASLAFMTIVFIVYLCLLLFLPAKARPADAAPVASPPAMSRGWGRVVLVSALAFAAPFLFDLYLPIRGAAGAFLAPPHLASLPGFLEHVLATGFEGDFFYFAHWKDLPDRLAILGNILAFQFNPWLLVGMAAGGLLALWRDWKLFLLLAGSFAVHSFVAITYRAPQTVEYMLPAYVVLAVALGYGLGLIKQALQTASIGSKAAGYALRITYYAFPLAALLLLARNLPSYARLARDESARTYAETVLNAAPPGALVLSAWHWATPMWYLQQVEGLRPDVQVEYVFPQGESLAQNWVERLAASAAGRPTVVTSYYPVEYRATPFRFVPLGPAWLVSTGPVDAPPNPLEPVEATFGGRWRLAGYALETVEAPAGATLPAVVAWVAPDPPEDISFFVQLIGPDGALYGQMDVNHPASRAAAGEWLIDRYLVTVRPDAPPGDYVLVAGAYRPDGVRLALDGAAQDTFALGTVRIALASQPAVTRHPVFRPFASSALTGYDFDRTLPDSIRLYLHWRLGASPETATLWVGGSPFAELPLPAGPGYLTTALDLPPYAANLQVVVGPPRVPWLLDWNAYSLRDPAAADRYVPLGGAMVLTGAQVARVGQDQVRVDLEFLSAGPLVEDDIIKVDLIGPNFAWRAESNAVPAGGAIPTLKWVTGSRVGDPYRLAIPPEAAPGPARLELAVYDHFTNRVLPILDPRLALLGSTVPLGPIEVQP